MPKEPVQRDAEATQAHLLAVATAAFAASGFDAVRVDQLAATAGVNKRMIYHYFGDKRGLYDAVLEAAALPLQTPEDLQDLAAWQAAVAAGLSGTRARLLAWEGLRLGSVAPDPGLAGASVNEAGRLPQQAQEDVALLFAALSLLPELCPQLVGQIAGQDPDSAEFQERWRRFNRRLVRLIESASSAPKERVRLSPKAKPTVR